MQQRYLSGRKGILRKAGQSLSAAALVVLLSGGAYNVSYASESEILIPQIGTAGVMGISVQKEMAIGDFFMRTARSNMNVLDDPVMSEYVTSLGNRLLAHADGVNFPFEFFMVRNNTLNASAFLGGKVAINTGLFNYAKTEDEFASVIAHEISHVTQRHIARFVELATASSRLSTAGIIGAVAMSIINPAFGVAAMTTAVGAQMQSRINFTRDNEYEADRVGISLMYKAGLNPKGTVDLFRTMLSQQGNINPAFTLLIDHPLNDIRLAEAQNRVTQYERRNYSQNPDYDMARARVAVRYSGASGEQQLKTLKQALMQNGEHNSAVYQNYALSLVCLELKQLDEARSYLTHLPSKLQNNIFVLDVKTDIDLKAGNSGAAIERLQQAYRYKPNNQALVINLAYAYIESKQFAKAKSILDKYLRNKPNDALAVSLIEKAYSALNDKCSAMQSRAELYAISGGYSQAIGMYNRSLQECSDRLTRERIKARVSQIVIQRSFDEELIKGL